MTYTFAGYGLGLAIAGFFGSLAYGSRKSSKLRIEKTLELCNTKYDIPKNIPKKFSPEPIKAIKDSDFYKNTLDPKQKTTKEENHEGGNHQTKEKAINITAGIKNRIESTVTFPIRHDKKFDDYFLRAKNGIVEMIKQASDYLDTWQMYNDLFSSRKYKCKDEVKQMTSPKILSKLEEELQTQEQIRLTTVKQLEVIKNLKMNYERLDEKSDYYLSETDFKLMEINSHLSIDKTASRIITKQETPFTDFICYGVMEKNTIRELSSDVLFQRINVYIQDMNIYACLVEDFWTKVIRRTLTQSEYENFYNGDNGLIVQYRGSTDIMSLPKPDTPLDLSIQPESFKDEFLTKEQYEDKQQLYNNLFGDN
jgi:hypothetical protein